MAERILGRLQMPVDLGATPTRRTRGAEPAGGSPPGGGSGPFELPVGARVERDLAYGPQDRHRCDVYVPPAPAGAPVLFLVHGGGWRRGRKDHWNVVRNKVAHWVGRGYVLVSTNYRLVPDTDPLGQAHDIARALAWVQANLARWDADPARVALMGHSAGAHLITLLTAAPDLAAARGALPWRATVALDSGALDVEAIMRRQHYPLYDEAFGSDPGLWREVSPTLRLAGPPVAPTLIVCSTLRDDALPQARAYAARAAGFGGRVEVLPLALSHVDINRRLGLPVPYTAVVEDFLRSTGMP